MAFKRWGCEFDGPWPNTDILKQRKGIWVIWRKLGYQWDVISVGESGNVRASLTKPESVPSLPAEGGTIHYSATYTPRLSEADRRKLASRIQKVSDHR
jgi:hypothetical protein